MLIMTLLAAVFATAAVVVPPPAVAAAAAAGSGGGCVVGLAVWRCRACTDSLITCFLEEGCFKDPFLHQDKDPQP